MRISTSRSKNTIIYYIIKDYTKNGKRSTAIVERLGNKNKISELAEAEDISVELWLKNYLEKYKQEHCLEKETITVAKDTSKLIPKNQNKLFNVGYLFLKDIYYDLKLNEICDEICEKYKFKFDLNEVLSNLVYSRIIYPSSKLKTHKLSKKFIEPSNIDLVNMYRSLTYLTKEMDLIQERLFENSLNVLDRNSKVIYFDCTNYYFEIPNENEFQKFGINKQHQPSPQVGMGLFMDGDGIPLAFNIYPGNESETKQLIPTQNKIINNFKLPDSKLILCTDSAMCTDEIKKENVKNGRGFVITQSLKKMKKEYLDIALNPTEWRISKDKRNLYNIDDIQNDETLSKKYKDTLFYKIIGSETKSVKQDIIVTFSLKYKEYHSSLRQNQIERAERKIQNNKGKKIEMKVNQNDFKRFINETSSTKDGEVAEVYNYDINKNLIAEESKFDGFYGLSTNLIDDIEVILKVAKGRWEIEESFRIMKTDFKARPVHLSNKERIEGHFLTCYLSLLIYRILEKKLNEEYTTTQILDTIRNMNVFEHTGSGYSPVYERTDLTDSLHDKFSKRSKIIRLVSVFF
ncbi:MAG: IS1634 family transposase [Mycoplasmatota bacterium]